MVYALTGLGGLGLGKKSSLKGLNFQGLHVGFKSLAFKALSAQTKMLTLMV